MNIYSFCRQGWAPVQKNNNNAVSVVVSVNKNLSNRRSTSNGRLKTIGYVLFTKRSSGLKGGIRCYVA